MTSLFRTSLSAAVLLVCSQLSTAAVTLQWVQGTVPANAQTVGNSTINGKLPPGDWQVWNLRVTVNANERFSG